MNVHVIRAVFRRNFVSYFTNPTGYVFICVFVLLSSFAAFWPNEFFNANLANLDQLNKYLPFILLVFIPAITMSIWADERRQGTDELLLTIPAAISTSCWASTWPPWPSSPCRCCSRWSATTWCCRYLGDPDVGLFLGTYVGYWLVGLAMLAIGMVASFLTGNLTVGFILGVLFNAPLAFAGADVRRMAGVRCEATEHHRAVPRFGRGVISLSSVAYFLTIVALMLYLSMVLIGRRHWRGGVEGSSMAGHYAVRVSGAGRGRGDVAERVS